MSRRTSLLVAWLREAAALRPSWSPRSARQGSPCMEELERSQGRRRWALLPLAVTALASPCCDRAQAPPPSYVTPSASERSPVLSELAPAPSASASSAPGETTKLIATTLAQVSRLRQLSVLHPVPGVTLPREELARRATLKTPDDPPEEEVKANSTWLAAFGFIPVGYDIDAGMQKLLVDQLAGFYDPHKKAMFLSADLKPAEAYETLAHELVHALQDQHYDLASLLKHRPEDGDRSSAIHALAEGDALSAGYDMSLADQGQSSLDLDEDVFTKALTAGVLLSPGAASIPSLLKTTLVSPYIDGFRFVRALREAGGWEAVNRAWEHLPETTEQLLHMDKYASHEPALPVPSPPLALFVSHGEPPLTVQYTDIVGEQGMRLMLEEWSSRRQAAQAAAGWGGDRMFLLERQVNGAHQQVAGLQVLYDRQPDGTCPSMDALTKLLKEHFGAAKHPTASRKGAPLCLERTGLPALVARIESCEVVLLTAPFVQEGSKLSSPLTCGGLGQALAPFDRTQRKNP